MERVKEGDKVAINYTITLDDGSVYDSSEASGVRTFVIGKGETFNLLEKSIIGMAPGESKHVFIPVDEGYGPHDEAKVFQFNRSRAPKDFDPIVGDRVEMKRADGTSVLVTVLDKSPEVITMDCNHPLAGKNLALDVTLLEILPKP